MQMVRKKTNIKNYFDYESFIKNSSINTTTMIIRRSILRNHRFKKIKKQSKVDDGIELFKKALDNVAPMLEVKSKRIGGATYQVPIEISEGRRLIRTPGCSALQPQS
mgnify:CR=1 FL=1